MLSETTGQFVRGYPVQIFKSEFLAQNDKFLCRICTRVLRNPIQLACGHRYCRTCMEQLIATNNGGHLRCPQCVDENSDDVYVVEPNQLFPDNAIRREMLKLPVQCCYVGCQWTGTFKDFTEKHYEQHPRESTVSKCPFDCGQQIATETSVESHLRDEAARHLLLTADRLRAVERQLGTATGAASSGVSSASILARIDELDRKLSGSALSSLEQPATASSRLPALTAQNVPAAATAAATAMLPLDKMDKMTIMEGVLVVLNREVEKLSVDMDAMQRLSALERDKLDSAERKAKSLERLITIKDVTIAELTEKIAALEQVSLDGTITWRIPEVTRKRQEAINARTTSIYSPPFYTSRTGYKMCLRLYLNGDGMGRGTHVSVFFVIMRGNFDPLLRWPFRQKVTLTLLNQLQREHVVDAFRPDPTSSSFKRPSSDMNIASGCPMFVSLDDFNNPAKGYVKDDTMFIKAIVDCADLTST